MKDYLNAVESAGIGRTPELCQDAMVEMLEELFEGKFFSGQTGRKELKVYEQDLPIPQENDSDTDTDAAAAPYIVVRLSDGVVKGDNDPQEMNLSLIICAYDTGLTRQGWKDVANIKEDIVQRACAKPYFGGAFTILKPITWAFQEDDTHPYYFGAVNLICTAPAMTQDTALKELL